MRCWRAPPPDPSVGLERTQLTFSILICKWAARRGGERSLRFCRIGLRLGVLTCLVKDRLPVIPGAPEIQAPWDASLASSITSLPPSIPRASVPQIQKLGSSESRIQDIKASRFQEFKISRIQAFKISISVQDFKLSRIHESKISRLLGFLNSRFTFSGMKIPSNWGRTRSMNFAI